MRHRLRVSSEFSLVVAISQAAMTSTAEAAKSKSPKGHRRHHGVGRRCRSPRFTAIGSHFEKRYKGTTINFNFAASSALVAQIQGGAPADVFASADGSNMQKLVAGSQVTADPADFTANLLTIVVKKGNPENVRSISDLAKIGVVSLCADTVPCGKYAAQILASAGVTIATDKITRGPDVKATLTAVSAGDADAAIVYVTDAKSAASSVQAVKIPASLNGIAVNPIAPLAPSGNANLARAFVNHVTSSAGQKTLHKFGFLPPPTQ